MQVKAFEELKLICKRPMIAQIGGFKPADGIKSWFGGNFYMPKGESFPTYNGVPMIPLIQLDTSELSGLKETFGETKLIQIFIRADKLPIGVVESGAEWQLIEYSNLDELELKVIDSTIHSLKPFQIMWTEGVTEYPCWEEAWDYVDLSEVNESEDLSDTFFNEFTRYTRTKVGGYASYIQSPQHGDLEFVMQISSEQKPNFMVGDNGNIYILRSKTDKKWYLGWDCY